MRQTHIKKGRMKKRHSIRKWEKEDQRYGWRLTNFSLSLIVLLGMGIAILLRVHQWGDGDVFRLNLGTTLIVTALFLLIVEFEFGDLSMKHYRRVTWKEYRLWKYLKKLHRRDRFRKFFRRS